MTWPPPPLRVDQSNTLVQFNNHPVDHVDVNTRVNLLAEQMGVLIAFAPLTANSPLLNIASQTPIISTGPVDLRAGHYYRCSVFFNYYSADANQFRKTVNTSVTRGDNSVVGPVIHVNTAHTFDNESHGSACGWVIWYQSVAEPGRVFRVSAAMSSQGNGATYALANANNPGAIAIHDLGRLAV